MNNKNNRQLYQSIFNQIHAPQELLNRVKNISEVKTKKKLNIKVVTVIAACLVFVILGTTIISSVIGGKNTFILKANATEIGSASLIKIATVSPIGGYSGNVTNGDNKDITMGSILPFTVICNGKNIKTIKYTIKNGVFIFPYNSYGKDYRKIYPDASALSYKIYNKIGAKDKVVNGVEENQQYTSYEVNYNDQTELEKYTDLQTFPVQVSTMISSADNISSNAKDKLEKYISPLQNSEDMYTNSLSDEKYLSQLMDAFKVVYDEMYSKVLITVEVTYDDGTTDCETLKLGCDKVSEKEGIVIGAKIIDYK